MDKISSPVNHHGAIDGVRSLSRHHGAVDRVISLDPRHSAVERVNALFIPLLRSLLCPAPNMSGHQRAEHVVHPTLQTLLRGSDVSTFPLTATMGHPDLQPPQVSSPLISEQLPPGYDGTSQRELPTIGVGEDIVASDHTERKPSHSLHLVR